MDIHEPHISDVDTSRRLRGRRAVVRRATPSLVVACEPDDQWDADALFQWVTSHGPTEPDRDGPWAVLGLTPDATWLEVVRRHRELGRRHHPDLVADAGPEERAASQRRMAEVAEAFDELAAHYLGERSTI
ncbi:MAG: J domain-containing protein [Acidimicrobiales bacterium]